MHKRFLSEAVRMLLMAVLIVPVFVDLDPGLPDSGLDPSWQIAVNQAVQQKLTFGKDLIFTYGPFATVSTHNYHPATDRRMLYGSIFVGLCFSLLSGMFLRRYRWQRGLLALPVLLALEISPDTLFLSYPLLFTALILGEISEPSSSSPSRLWDALLILLSLPLGLLPLVKGTLIIICSFCLAISLCGLFARRHFVLGTLLLVAPSLFMAWCWSVAGNSLPNMPGFFLSMKPIILGYTEAMSTEGLATEWITYAVVALSICLCLASARKPTFVFRFLFLAAVSGYLLLSFKEGFVRHDGHALAAAGALIFAGCLVDFRFGFHRTRVAYALSCLCAYFIAVHHVHGFPKVFGPHLGFIKGVAARFKRDYASEYKQRLDRIAHEANFPILEGRSDIYSSNQALLIASGNQWAPRPVLQGYSSYTPDLLELDRRYLNGESRPDNIFFKIEPIDDRLPAIEEGASWPTLLVNYDPVKILGEYILLKKRELPLDRLAVSSRTTANDSLGSWVEFKDDQSTSLRFLKIDVQPTFIGRVLNKIFKSSKLYLETEFVDGSMRRDRVIPAMLQSGFLLSPFVTTAEEFALLWTRRDRLQGQEVRRFRVVDNQQTLPLWQSNYAYEVEHLTTPQARDLAQGGIFMTEDSQLAKRLGTLASTQGCVGAVDNIGVKHAPPKGVEIKSGSAVSINGWLSITSNPLNPPKAVYVVLRNLETRQARVFKAELSTRKDVYDYFGQEVKGPIGFKGTIDASDSRGRYALGLARSDGTQVELCDSSLFDFKVSVGQ